MVDEEYVLGFESTYKELKLGRLKTCSIVHRSFESTYKELKQNFHKHQKLDKPVLSLPIRN